MDYETGSARLGNSPKDTQSLDMVGVEKFKVSLDKVTRF